MSACVSTGSGELLAADAGADNTRTRPAASSPGAMFLLLMG
ncbi:hypothetical protein ACFSVJ_27530 [Prauserella oleivorans]